MHQMENSYFLKDCAINYECVPGGLCVNLYSILRMDNPSLTPVNLENKIKSSR